MRALRLHVSMVPRASALPLRCVASTAAARIPLPLVPSRVKLHSLQRPSSAATWATQRRTPDSLLSTHRRGYANVLGERRKELEKLAALFSEARDEIENARESAGTTYFNEDFAEAKSCATNALDYYNQLLNELQPEEAIKLKEEQNPKMEQLKMELSMLEELAAD